MGPTALSHSKAFLRGTAAVAAGRPTSARRGKGQPAATRASAAAKRSAIVTGANTGIGLETVKGLTSQGIMTVLACRDPERAAGAISKIREAVPDADVTAMRLDLASLASVRDFTNEYLDSGRPLEILINNAGVMAIPSRELTEDGFERQVGVNHFGHFLLTAGLMDKIKEAESARIVNVASSAHMFGKMNFGDVNYESGGYQAWVAYGQSKLANVLFTYELARRLPADGSITTNCLHPGVVNTELFRYNMPGGGIDDLPFFVQPFAKVAEGLVSAAGSQFFKTPAQGAETSIYLATSSEAENVSGKYFSDCKPIASSPISYSTSDSARLWELSEELTMEKKPATTIVMFLFCASVDDLRAGDSSRAIARSPGVSPVGIAVRELPAGGSYKTMQERRASRSDREARASHGGSLKQLMYMVGSLKQLMYM